MNHCVLFLLNKSVCSVLNSVLIALLYKTLRYVPIHEFTFKNKPSLRKITEVKSMTACPDSPLLGFIEDGQSQFSQAHYFLIKYSFNAPKVTSNKSICHIRNVNVMLMISEVARTTHLDTAPGVIWRLSVITLSHTFAYMQAHMYKQPHDLSNRIVAHKKITTFRKDQDKCFKCWSILIWSLFHKLQEV